MKLLTKEILKKFEKQGYTGTKKAEEVKVIAKFFNPCGSQTWYATEYDPKTRIFFGYVDFYGDGQGELGSFSLDELESLRLPFGLSIERDLYFGTKTLKEVMG